GAEEPRRAILERDATVTLDRRCPHPLIRRAVRVIDDEQRDTFHFGRRREPQHGLAAAVRSEPFERPPLVAHLALRVEHLQQSFIALRLRVGPLLRLLHYLPRAVRRAQL